MLCRNSEFSGRSAPASVLPIGVRQNTRKLEEIYVDETTARHRVDSPSVELAAGDRRD